MPDGIRLEKKRVVVFGGGNGSATTLGALKRYADEFDISAVISMADSSGSSGRLCEEFSTLPAGDVLRAILALSSLYDYKNFLKPLFYKKRFKGIEKLNDHNLGNLFLVLIAQYTGDFVSAIRALEQVVEAVGTVYPATLEKTDLVAELENGDIVRTEGEIDRPRYDRSIKIKKVHLAPKSKAYSGALKAIEEADFIIFGPGSLYTSVIAAILAEGIFEAIGKTNAKLIYIAGNKYELDGETGPTCLCQYLWTLEEYLPKKIDTIIFNTIKLNSEQEKYYKEKNWILLEYNPEHIKRTKVVGQSFERNKGGLDSEKLGVILKREINSVKSINN